MGTSALWEPQPCAVASGTASPPSVWLLLDGSQLLDRQHPSPAVLGAPGTRMGLVGFAVTHLLAFHVTSLSDGGNAGDFPYQARGGSAWAS